MIAKNLSATWDRIRDDVRAEVARNPDGELARSVNGMAEGLARIAVLPESGQHAALMAAMAAMTDVCRTVTK